VLAISANAQQIASTNLLRPCVADAALTEPVEKSEESNECATGGVGFADGVTLNKDKVPRKIRVELVQIDRTRVVMGSEIAATAKLQNMSNRPIQIPWSTDFQTTMKGQSPDERYWDFGEFRMSVRDKHNKHYFDRLVTTSRPLYASRIVPGSSLTVKPGEWITARISFKVKVQNQKFVELNVGEADLAMEWFQTSRSRVVKNCGVTLGYFPYDDPFDSLNRRVVARIQIKRAGVAGGPAQ
jgi:hypothetical protein